MPKVTSNAPLERTQQCFDCCEEFASSELKRNVKVKQHPIQKLLPLLCKLCWQEYRNLRMLASQR